LVAALMIEPQPAAADAQRLVGDATPEGRPAP